MTFRRNLIFHRRANLAVLLGVAVGTAVLTGALLVGDSLRGSLRDRALRQLGWVEAAMVSGRFLREDVAKNFNNRMDYGISFRATAERTDDENAALRIPDISLWASAESMLREGNVLTIEDQQPDWRIWQYLPGLRQFSVKRALTREPWTGEAILSPTVAQILRVKEGDKLKLQVPKGTDIPAESLLGRRGAGETAQELAVTVGGILAGDVSAADFSLAPGIRQPRNVFVNLQWLQDQIGEPGRVNVLMTSGQPVAELQAKLRDHLTLDDWGLTLQTPESRADERWKQYEPTKNRRPDSDEGPNIPGMIAKAAGSPLTREKLLDYYRKRGIVTLTSRQLMIEPAIERAALDVAKEMGIQSAPTLVYIANSISDGTQSIPYSVVGALDPSLPPPLGPFLPPPSDDTGTAVVKQVNPTPDQPTSEPKPLADDEIVLVRWPDSPMMAKPGDKITLTYFDPNQEGNANERSAEFKLRGFIPLSGVAADPDLTPEFPGITDRLDMATWDPPPPFNSKTIQDKIGARDKKYWRDYRTTPKAYITLAAGKKFFGTRFGDITSIRLASGGRQSPEKFADEFASRLLKTLRPEQGGFIFEDVRERALRASNGGMDFGLLFLGFSIFLIAAALLLVGLLVRLALDRRASEVGLLIASGFNANTVRRLFLKENLILAAIGGLIGLVGAIAYAALMLRLLVALWPEGSVGSFLTLHVNGLSLLIGYFTALFVSAITIWWAVRALNRVAPTALLAGVTQPENGIAEAKPRRWRRWLMIGAAVSALGLLVSGLFVHDAEARAGTFFSGGMLLLIAALSAVGNWLRRPASGHVHPDSLACVARLGVRNATRNPLRSLLTASLIASAAFLLVAVESFRRSPEADFGARHGGSGGFALIAETDLPLYRDPASPEGRQDLLEALEKAYQRDQATKPKKLMDSQSLLEITPIIPLRLKSGDDASCLNLYQPGRPRILGVPPRLIERDGFRFADTNAKTSDERANPWLLLNQSATDDAIPVFGEEHSAQWMLKSDLGGTIEIPDEQGRPQKLRFVGLLQDSVFQSEILMSDANFKKLFPKNEGFSIFLLDPPAGHVHDVTSLFQTALDSRGVRVTPAKERLAAYLAVENTYLSTFQVLGGFGLLLGALGLAVVLLRNVWERRAELALLRALGYRRLSLGWLVFSENAALLLLGLAAGIGSAAAAVAPHVFIGEGAVPWARLGVLLGLVLAVGFAAGGTAVRSTVRAPLVPALRKE